MQEIQFDYYHGMEAELDMDRGIGLIGKRCLRLGKPNIIYVKNFIIRQIDNGKREEKALKTPVNTLNSENHTSGMVEITI